MNPFDLFLILIVPLLLILEFIRSSRKKKKLLREQLESPFPDLWRKILTEKVIFYEQLSEKDKLMFEERLRLFLATKTIRGIDTEIDDAIRLMVAASAIIPTFAFPGYNYPNVQTILIYPNSFDEQFRTNRYKGHQEFITGIVGNRSLNGTVILSKSDLVKAFDGLPNEDNVGIHEFVHLLDKEDGVVDGIPEILIQRPFVGPWLNEIKTEMKLIEAGKSDINPYAITNNAEFLAVVSEYFFDNPEKFQNKHPELYKYLSVIFNKQ